jgi:hypothetical protein
MENKNSWKLPVGTGVDSVSPLEPCCSQNCGTNMCARQRRFVDIQKSESFTEGLKNLKEIKNDEYIRENDKPKLYKQTMPILAQRAKPNPNCRKF